MSTAALRWSMGVGVLTVLALAVPRATADIFEAHSSRDRDTTIFQNNPDNSLGGGVTIYAGKNNNNYRRRSLIAFDLSGIPSGSIINSVELDLVLAQVSGGSSGLRTIGLHKLLGDWGDGTSGWGEGPGATGQGVAPPFPSGEHPATWTYQFYNTDPWTSEGGDFAGAASASTSVGTTLGTKSTWNSTAMVADVQGWVNGPASNFGWLLMGDESESGTFRAFWSKEAYLVGLRNPPLPTGWFEGCEPKLVIDYTAVPEPSSLALFAGGAVALLVVRRVRQRSVIPGRRTASDLRRN